MGNQTTLTGSVTFPDGAKVQIKESGGSYTDIGALNSAIGITMNYDEQTIETSNAGTLDKRIRNMKVDGSFTLINLDMDNIDKFGGGIFTKTVTAGSTVVDADITDQSIVGYTAGVPIALSPVVTSTGSVIKFSTTPVITSVEASSSGTLTLDDDYVILVDAESSSGYSISFIGAGTLTPGTSETYTVDFGDNIPVARTELAAGTTTKTLTAYSLKFTHTDSSGLIREVELFSVNTNSGGLQFNFKGANEDGVEEMPIAFTGEIDTSLTDGYQLIKITRDQGAA